MKGAEGSNILSSHDGADWSWLEYAPQDRLPTQEHSRRLEGLLATHFEVRCRKPDTGFFWFGGSDVTGGCGMISS